MREHSASAKKAMLLWKKETIYVREQNLKTLWCLRRFPFNHSLIFTCHAVNK